MTGLYLQLSFSFHKSTILRRAWVISPELKKKEKIFSLISIWILVFKTHQFSQEIPEKNEQNVSILCRTLQDHQSRPLPVVAVTVLYVGVWWQEDSLSLAIFSPVLFSSGCHLSRTKFWLFSLSEHILQSPDNTYAKQPNVKHGFPWC